MSKLREEMRSLSEHEPRWGVVYWILGVLFLIPLLTALYSLPFRLVFLLFPSALSTIPNWLSMLITVVILASCFMLAVWSVIKMWKMSKRSARDKKLNQSTP